MRSVRRMSAAGLVMVAAVAMGTVAPAGVAAAPDPALATPEATVRAYLAGVAAADADAILAASAVDRMAEGVDFVALVDRMQVWVPFQAPMPPADPFLTELNRAQQTALLLGQVRMLTYGFLTDADLSGAPVRADAAWAERFAAQIDTARLGGLAVGAIAFPDPAREDDPRYRDLTARQAAIYGADELTERIADVTLEGQNWIVGFTLLRFGDEWRVASQTSALGGTPPGGAPLPVGG